jgi:NADH dehydrogenase FAD-containing subunit
VTVIEEGPHVGLEMAHPRRMRAVHEATAHGVRIERDARPVEITAQAVVCARGDERFTVPAGSVLLAAGVAPDPSFADELVREGFDVRTVGDAATVGYIQGAIRTGHLAVRDL